MRSKQHPRVSLAWAVVAVAGLLLAGSPSGTGEVSSVATVTAAQLHQLDDIMRRKLEHGRALLEGVVLANFSEVERHAHELTLLSEASTWTPLRTVEYLRFAAAFRDASSQLEEAANRRDMENVTGAYVELVTTCVQCHRHVRGAARAD